MQDHSRRLSEPLSWGRREKRVVAAVGSAALAGVVALLVFALTTGAPPRRDCVDVTFASTLGGAELKGCGEQARRICQAGGAHAIEGELREACQRAGLPFRGRT